MNTRVVVTGMGAITPIGNDVESFWQALKDKTLGIAPITYFDTEDFKCKLAAEVKGFDPNIWMPRPPGAWSHFPSLPWQPQSRHWKTQALIWRRRIPSA